MKLTSLYIVFFLFFTELLHSQTPSISLTNFDTVYNEYKYRAFANVENFNGVGSFQIKIAFDNTLINISELPAASFNGRGMAVGMNPNTNGELVVVWISDGINPLNFGSGELFEFEFIVLPNAASIFSELNFIQTIVSNTAGNNLGATYSNSNFYIIPPESPIVNIDFIGNSSQGIIGVPVRVNKFNNIGSFIFEIDYDKTRVEFTSLSEINPEIFINQIFHSISSVDTYTNRLKIEFQYDGITPLFIENNEILFVLNYDYLNNQLLANLNFNNCLVNLPSGNSLFPVFLNGGIGGIVSVKDKEILPKEFGLSNYPNPFNSATNIIYEIPYSSFVNIEIFNTNGELIESLVNEIVEAGSHRVQLNAKELCSGPYFYRLRTKDFSITNKLLLIN